ncbi:MAG: nickel-dependent lactate racemase [Clostridiales Family XIII bacterium]|jgi:hypothetical protein|nr:nickel-dependent lactate racemase [Clostridiales Family XIII bacterium]
MFPKMVKIKQSVPAPELENVADEIRKQITLLQLNPTVFKGKKIGITAGSRGITNIPLILKTLISIVRDGGGLPHIVAAMGSHGGATAEGQGEMLASLGITEESMGAPILCNEEVIQVGKTKDDIPVYVNSEAAKLDGLIICNRVKGHTDFSGEIESGLCKMMTIGLGNHKGASTAHFYAVNYGYTEMIQESARVIMENTPVLFGLGIVENWKNGTMVIRGTLPDALIETEKELLEIYKETTLKLPFKSADILIVGELGKNISGAGMDTKVIGRIKIIGQKEPDYPKITNIAVLGLTEASHGNATGIGLADYTTESVYRQIDLKATTINGLTSMSPDQIKLPVILDTDKEAIEWAYRTLGPAKEGHVSIAYILNTMSLEELVVSENMLDTLKGEIEIIGEAKEFAFTEDDTLISPLL